ncbi:hypothetical protein [Kitasatospora sp. LaBMicrA B282]|uniref:hypothetical protein n=1 Tax=Kitasatospora sp. LaBMicrA B282 TaxID=3420949 RepID=UPI003D10D680
MSALSPARNRVAALTAVLCLAVAWIHVQDQGGLPGSKTPRYVGIGYYLLETTGLLCALALLSVGRTSLSRLPWLLATGVALGPMAGYLLSRGPGLPGYTDDKGNWTEPLGLLSLAVEAALLTTAATVLLLGRPVRQAGPTAPRPATVRRHSSL